MRIRKLLGIVVSFAIVFSIMPLQVLADEISDSLKCRSLSEASYTVSENVITTWPGHANIEIVFTNTGDAPICNWNYTFEFVYNIENPYNCTVLEHEGDLYTVGNSGWNKDIGPGESVTIGFTASSNDGSDIEYMPSFYLLNNANNILPEGSITVDYVEYSDWTSGSSGALILTNNTDSSIGNWTITFSANRPITDAYDVSFSVNDDGTYTISGGSYSDISAGGTHQIGIQCGEHDSTIPFEINNLIVSSSTLALDLNEDTNNNGVPDVSEIDYNGFITTPTPTVTDTPTVTEEPTPTTTDAPTDTPEPTPTEFVFTPDQDLDGDGLYTSEEEMYGTDPNNPDSDSDGVSDGNEVQMIYFPTEADSDLDGILDGDEDYDGDGIINRDEESYGSCPYAADSDYDDINDYEEIFTYSTDPYEEDSDGDYILDGDELALGLDPTTDTTESVQDNENTQDYSFASTSEQIAEYNTDDQPFSFSFDIKAAGRVDKYIKAQETGYKYAIEDNSTILGKSPEIVYDYAMKVDSVTVNFTMKNGYEADIDKYCVFYYWEGYNILIPIETEYDYDTGTVYATNSMIGTYCLVDTEQMYDFLGINEEVTDGKNNSKKYLKSEAEETDQESNPTYTVSDAKVYNGHEYFLITSDTPMLYDEAVAVCDQFGGYPAVITSAEENAFIESVSNAGWIGGKVRFHGINTPTVEWITGEGSTYTYWAFGSYNANDFPKWEGFPLTTAGVWGWSWRDPETYTEKSVICECEITGKSVSALTFGEEDIELNCYSDSDIDGDGVLDFQELSGLDLGVFDESTGNYIAASLEEYADIAKNHGIPVSGEIMKVLGRNRVSSFNSDPYSSDKDGDGYADLEDARPNKENDDAIIILYWETDGVCIPEAIALEAKYRNLGFKCEKWGFDGYNSFIEQWSLIGETQDSFVTNLPYLYAEDYYGLYFYNVTDVVLISHGTSMKDEDYVIPGVYIELGFDDKLCPQFTAGVKEGLLAESSNYYFIEDIGCCRKFDSLDMLICNAATQLYPELFEKNLAETFISHFSSINNVYAFDCVCTIETTESGLLAWVALIQYGTDYDDSQKEIYDEIFASGDDAFVGKLEQYYPKVYSGLYGQVCYSRSKITGKVDFNYDLYPDNKDTDYYFEVYNYPDGKKHSRGLVGQASEENNGFDPVLI